MLACARWQSDAPPGWQQGDGGLLRRRLDAQSAATFAKNSSKEDQTLLGATVLQYNYKRTLIRTKEGEAKWVATKTIPKEVFKSAACVIL